VPSQTSYLSLKFVTGRAAKVGASAGSAGNKLPGLVIRQSC